MDFCDSYIKIDLDAIWDNFLAIKAKAGVPALAIVKSDAYGHGVLPVARLLEPECAFFGVATVAEALNLRKAGIEKPILILGHTPPEAFSHIIPLGIRPAIFSWEDALALSQQAEALKIPAPFHFALDTGMHRLGFPATEKSADICQKITQLPFLQLEGLYSHFATADSADLTYAKAQTEKFEEFNNLLQQRGVSIPIRHMDNSAGIMNFDTHYDMIRCGISIYGLYPSNEVNPQLLPLRPAMSWHSRICHIQHLEAGMPISYGATFVTNRPTRVATVCAGYGDGYRRSLSNQFYVLLKGQKAPILGRICMNLMMIDVTHIPDADVGDWVVLMGTDGDLTISAETLAEAANSLSYEQIITAGLHCPHYYYRNGICVEKVEY